MKKLLLALTLVLTLTLGGCASEKAEATDIVVLVPNATHGWTGAVMTYAQEKVDEINEEGAYTAELLSAPDAATQITQIEDIIANKTAGSVVILPMDNTLEAAMKQLVATDIPVVQFDRAISSVEDDVVATVLGDNEGIGYATAERFTENGLEPGDEVYVLIGDTSSVPGMRNAGFEAGLLDNGWTQAQIDESVTYSAPTGWQRTQGQQLFVDWMNSMTVEEISEFEWIFTHDDPIAMGVLDALKTSEIEEAKKEAFLSGHVNLAASAGAAEMYSVLKGVHEKDYTEEVAGLNDLFSVTYDPAMIQIAIDDMVKHLDGESVDKLHVIPVEVVDANNVDNYRGFGDSFAK